MLVDLPGGWKDPTNHEFVYHLRNALGQSGTEAPLRVYRGVYLAHINFNHEIGHLIKNDWPSFTGGTDWTDFDYRNDDLFNSYGVVDHWTQLPLKRLDGDDRPLLVFLGRHAKADQSPRGGWRWHKWGPYLGVFREQAAAHEYLYDTPDVVEVWSYQVVELKPEVGRIEK